MILVLTSFASFIYINTKKNTEDATITLLEDKAKSISKFIDLWLFHKKNIMYNARDEFRQDIYTDEQIQEKLAEYSKILNALDTYYGTEDGKTILGTGNKVPNGYVPRQRDWYIKAKDSKKNYCY